MMMLVRSITVFVALGAPFIVLMYRSSQDITTSFVQRNRHLVMVAKEDESSTNTTTTTTKGSWCAPPSLPPLDYRQCNHSGTFNRIQFHAGLTNGLKFLLLNAIRSFEENRCFFVDESHNHLLMRHNASNTLSSFINRYFEPIGLDPNDPLVLEAQRQGRVEYRDWQSVWYDLNKRRVKETKHTLPSLHYSDLEGHILKRIMLQRMWRPLPHVRQASCQALEQMGLLSGNDDENDFLALSVRRGDKTIEGFSYTPISEYIVKAETAMAKYPFHGKHRFPKVFVATDDCNVMELFRKYRPQWTFVSACDDLNTMAVAQQNGFVLNDMLDWDLAMTDAHFMKFFTELHALAIAKYYIGVSYTNVAWWAYFMRSDPSSFQLIDRNPRTTDSMTRNW